MRTIARVIGVAVDDACLTSDEPRPRCSASSNALRRHRAEVDLRPGLGVQEVGRRAPSGAAHFYRLMAQMCTIEPDESQLMFLAFDLLHQDGVDLRGLPLTERRRDLERLSRKAKVPYLRLVETFPDGGVLFDYCNKFGFEGIVSKRQDSRYASGPSRNWVKVKCPNWKRDNAERHKLFEIPRKPELTEAQKTLVKKRQELARVIEHLRSPPLSQGIARELRKQQAMLEREIAELESA